MGDVFGKVDDQEVWRIIGLELSLVSGATPVEKSYNAWQRLISRRRDGAHGTDVNLAAAEHYMYIRFLAGLTGDPVTRLAPTGYYLKKRLFFLMGKEKDMRTDERYPVLPPSLDSVAWGNQGAADGLDDYRGANPAAGIRVGKSLEALKGEAYRNNK
jgi:hypothetical protein